MIYFVRDELAGAIKIGVAVDPVKRFSMLQVGNPRPLHLIGVVPGNVAEEASLHARFKMYRLRGEWFASHPRLTEAINEMIQVYGGSAACDGPIDFTHADRWGTERDTPEDEWLDIQRTIRARVHKNTRIACTVYWGAEPLMTGSRRRVASFQIMPDDGVSERHPFWGWHSDNNPQWFASPGHAADSWIASFRFWDRFHRELAGKAPAPETRDSGYAVNPPAP